MKESTKANNPSRCGCSVTLNECSIGHAKGKTPRKLTWSVAENLKNLRICELLH